MGLPNDYCIVGITDSNRTLLRDALAFYAIEAPLDYFNHYNLAGLVFEDYCWMWTSGLDMAELIRHYRRDYPSLPRLTVKRFLELLEQEMNK